VQVSSMHSSPNLSVPAHHSVASAEASAMYSSYMQHEGYMNAHGFGGEGGSPYPFEAMAAGFQAAPSGAASAGAVAGVDGVPSIGSYAHLSGQCSRCCFHPKGRCANGYTCQFCHFDHDKRPRNGKKKRYRRSPDDVGEGPDDD
ncbi:unnamed protein product, partial [Polarella glacialis]